MMLLMRLVTMVMTMVTMVMTMVTMVTMVMTMVAKAGGIAGMRVCKGHCIFNIHCAPNIQPSNFSW